MELKISIPKNIKNSYKWLNSLLLHPSSEKIGNLAGSSDGFQSILMPEYKHILKDSDETFRIYCLNYFLLIISKGEICIVST